MNPNEHLYIEEPAGEEWTFSLNPALPRDAYSADRRLTADVDGLPFVDGQAYVVYAWHSLIDAPLSEPIIFRAGPTDRTVSDETDLPDLDQVARRGNATGLSLQVGGIKARAWPTATTAEYVFVERLTAEGLRELARLPVTALGIDALPDVPPTPVIKPVWAFGGIWEEVDVQPDTVLRWGFGGVWEEVDSVSDTVPLPPTQVAVSRLPGTRNAVLSWRDEASNETGYDVETSANGVDFSLLIPLGENVTVLPLNGLNLNQDYYYRIVPKNAAGAGPPSNVVKLRLVDYSVLFYLHQSGNNPPQIRQLLDDTLSASPGNGNIGAKISRPDGSAPTAADFDQMTLVVTDPTGAKHGWTTPDLQATSDTYFAYSRPTGGTLIAGRYVIQTGIYKVGQLIQQDRIGFDFSPPPRTPAAPSNLTVRRNSQQTGFILAWTDNADNEDVFAVDIQKPGEARRQYKTLPANTVDDESLISPLPHGTQFWLASRNNDGTSAYAGPASIAATAPGTVASIRARRVVSTAQIEIESILTKPGRVLWRSTRNANELILNQFPDTNQPAQGVPFLVSINDSASTIFFAARPYPDGVAVGPYRIDNPPNYPTDWQTINPA